jgi:CDGSH-type Zn-finger protein/uncharacterized Fe-S cluster protein YjdI
MAIEVAESRYVRILFDGSRCIHSRNCVLSRPDVFVPNVKGPWIHPENATPAEVAELAHNCPSGAIRYELLGPGAREEEPPRVNVVRVRENGPLAFSAEIQIRGEDPEYRVTLCRCGASSHKPYCDGSHADWEFAATGEPPVQESQPLAKRDGPLNITPTPNGPLHVQGPLEVVSGTGHTLNRVTETWLCRCGHSKNKPYCDGSHKKAGFSAPG